MIYSDTMTKHVSKVLVAIVLVLFALVVVLMSPLYGSASAQSFWNKVVPQSQAEIELSYAPLVKEVSPAVVNIYTKKTVQRRMTMQEFMYGRRFGDSEGRSVQNSLGSGVIVGEGGVVVTNNHVIDGADEVVVVLADRREYPAELILADERTDLASCASILKERRCRRLAMRTQLALKLVISCSPWATRSGSVRP